MKRMVVVGGVVALGLGILGLHDFKADSTEQQAIAAETAPLEQAGQVSRDVFYFSDRGFRFVIPRGYTVVPSEEQPSGSPVPIQHLEVWDTIAYMNRIYQTEAAPMIQIQVFDNAQGTSLQDWKGELSEPGDRPITIAGQEGLAYGATGLYEADNVVFPSPDGRFVIRMRGEYLTAADPIRTAYQTVLDSFTFDLVPPETSGATPQIDYSHLQRQLAAQNWMAADLETRAIVYRIWQRDQSGDFYYGSAGFAANFPCEDLQTLDRLWSAASQGRLGLRAQQRIWTSVAATTPDPRERVERFGEAVGWRRDPSTLSGDFNLSVADPAWKLETDLNYADPIPGQLPWAGISSSRLEGFLLEAGMGCGSCTTDAMYLGGDRYYDYLPALFERVENCACNGG